MRIQNVFTTTLLFVAVLEKEKMIFFPRYLMNQTGPLVCRHEHKAKFNIEGLYILMLALNVYDLNIL